MFIATLCRGLVLASLSFLLSGGATAQGAYPDKPIKLIVPFPAGGSTDAMGRIFGEKLGHILKVPVVVENIGGASGSVAARQFASLPPDGYALLLGTTTNLITYPLLSKKVMYDSLRDFAPVFHAADLPSVFLVNPELPVKDMTALKTYLEKDVNGGAYATGGVGTPGHLAAELYRLRTGLPMIHVPFQGGAPALLAVAGGHVKLSVAVLPDAMQHIHSGRLRALATTAAQRPKSLPDVPTVMEAGVKDFDVSSSYGFVVPTGTPAPIVDRLNAAFNEALADADVQSKLSNLGFETRGGPAAQFGQVMKQQKDTWAAVIRDANISID